ncbi:MAG: hypothetical protein JW795_08150 [Chitinivibrionales bacterium]|nr:hypothetical protein [Chitinivibrionales bacterium]
MQRIIFITIFSVVETEHKPSITVQSKDVEVVKAVAISFLFRLQARNCITNGNEMR